MQAVSYILATVDYAADMPMGRPAAKERTLLGERIATARQLAGLTQRELADKVKVSQRVVAYWEREAVSLRDHQLEALAEALDVTADSLVGRPTSKQRGPGPVGKARLLFKQVSQLPRHKRDKIVEVVEALVAQQSRS